MARPKGSKNKVKVLDGIDYTAQIADADAKVAETAKKAEAEDVLKKLLAEGMSTDEILEKLK